jgi:hypothetical protein
MGNVRTATTFQLLEPLRLLSKIPDVHWRDPSRDPSRNKLSTTEEDYIALSQSMREVIPFMWLLEEAKQHGIPVMNTKPRVHCKM